MAVGGEKENAAWFKKVDFGQLVKGREGNRRPSSPLICGVRLRMRAGLGPWT